LLSLFLDTKRELNCKSEHGIITGPAKNSREAMNASGCLICWSLQSSGSEKFCNRQNSGQ